MYNEPLSANFHIAVIHDRALSTVDKTIYIILCSHANSVTCECSPKVATIAAEASCSERTVRASLNVLEELGVIERTFRYIKHRQIPSLYKVIGANAPRYSAGLTPSVNEQTEIQHDASTTEKIADIEEVRNSTEQEYTYHDGGDNRREETIAGGSILPGEKTLESLKIPYGGACLPASAEKNSEETPPEEAKDSLTGGALLPVSQDETQSHEEHLAMISEDTEGNPVIKGECVRTDTPDTAHENPVIKDETACASSATTADVPPIPEWLLKRYEVLSKKYKELYASPEAPKEETPKKAEKVEASPAVETPVPGTDEFYQWKLETSRKNCAEMLPPTKESESLASGVSSVMAGIWKKRATQNEREGTATTEDKPTDDPAVIKTETNIPMAREEHMNANNAPADKQPAVKSQSVTAGDTPVVNTQAMEAHDSPLAINEHMTADDAPKSAEMDKQPVVKPQPMEGGNPPADKAPAPKKAGKRKVSRHPKELYSPADAPEVMRPTAEFFLLKTGRVALRWEEISVLRKLSATHYPTVVNKAIVKACERFKKRNESLLCLTLMYIEVMLRNYPTFGKKKAKKEQVPTAEEEAQRKAAIIARTKELQDELGIDIDERGNWIERKREE